MSGRSRSIPWSTIAIAIGCSGLALYLANVFWTATRVDVGVEGVAHRARVTSASLDATVVRFDVDPPDRVERAVLRLNGERVASGALDVEGSTIAWEPGRLPEGDHELALTVPRPVLHQSTHRWRFTVDDTPPQLQVPTLLPESDLCRPVTVVGRVEQGATVTLDGQPLPLLDGTFTLRYDRPPTAPLRFVATDQAGNETHVETIAPVRYPGGQGVHVTASAWAYEPLRRGVLDLVDRGLVSVVELDLKDEGGIVGYDSRVPLARQAGAVTAEYRLDAAVRELKARGVRVVGRMVAFRDPKLATWAWANGRRDWVVQTPDQRMLQSYGGFTNFAHPDVRAYNLDIALEAVSLGVDDILWDYVRRPEGDPAAMVFPGMRRTPSDEVIEFLAASRAALRERCAYQGASVFGIAADRPEAVGQDIPRMSRHVDYLAPMLYPSHWVNGEYGVRNPNRQPYDIVTAALADFQAKSAGTGVHLVPWLQDFSLGETYGPAQVRAQIEAAADLGVSDWLLWNAGVRYTAAALDPALVRLRS
jgi:hypothetical protein